jgi:uncharacterized protein
MQFQVHIEEIRERGLDYERELPQAFLEEALGGGKDAEFHAVGPGKFSGHFDKLPGRVMFSGRIEAAVQAPCKRCLAEVVRKSPIDFRMTWVSQRPDVQRALEEAGIDEEADAEGPNKGSFEDADVDTEPFDGEKVPLDPMIREQLLLSLPMDIVCKPDCKGLCSVCGQDLNERDCGHDRTVPDPRWSALKNLKLPN